MKLAHTEKKHHIRVSNDGPSDFTDSDPPATRQCFLALLVCTYTLHVRIAAWIFWEKNENRTGCRETTGSWPRPPPAESRETRKVRHVSPHRMVDLIARQGVCGSKPGRNLTSRLLRHGQHIYYLLLILSLRAGSSFYCSKFCRP